MPSDRDHATHFLHLPCSAIVGFAKRTACHPRRSHGLAYHPANRTSRPSTLEGVRRRGALLLCHGPRHRSAGRVARPQKRRRERAGHPRRTRHARDLCHHVARSTWNKRTRGCYRPQSRRGLRPRHRKQPSRAGLLDRQAFVGQGLHARGRARGHAPRVLRPWARSDLGGAFGRQRPEPPCAGKDGLRSPAHHQGPSAQTRG